MKPTPKSHTQLQPEERLTLASLHRQAYRVRSMAETRQRSPSPISRALRRNSQDSHYGSAVAHRRGRARRLQARPLGKRHPSTGTFDVVRHFLGCRRSPEQTMLTMARVHTKGHPYRVSTETIYRCIYAQPVGERRKELIGQSETGAQQTRPAQQRPGSARPYP